MCLYMAPTLFAWFVKALTAVSRPPTHRRRVTESSYDNNVINHHFVYLTCSSLYSVVLRYHYEVTKKAYRTHKEGIKKGASILALPLLLDVMAKPLNLPRYSNPRGGPSGPQTPRGCLSPLRYRKEPPALYFTSS